jgi:hypothetical protein
VESARHPRRTGGMPALNNVGPFSQSRSVRLGGTSRLAKIFILRDPYSLAPRFREFKAFFGSYSRLSCFVIPVRRQHV